MSAIAVNAEAKRILAVSISKLYASRSQRGGLRLHRSLLLSIVMRSARDIYHSAYAQAAAEEQEAAMDAAKQVEEASELHSPELGMKVELECLEREEEDMKSDVSESELADREDKENMHPTTRRSSPRKRRGNASVAPDFLPSKRARLEPGEERHAVAPGSAVGALGGCRVAECLTAFSLNNRIAMPAAC
ncbi:hypothetical protein NHX12_018101 [Muraenolepis orangiensis]|uniref:Immediate early response 2 n=1 Tax=Muraenolepis orangiensis TaxID=630683 RepID=A0A9Q0IX91_9TELE|nr:hypothetical protein NHX12_018101 [Muraenolepis orangiensis]